MTFFAALEARDGTEVDATAAATTTTITTCSAVRTAAHTREGNKSGLVSTSQTGPSQIRLRMAGGTVDALVCEMADLLAVERRRTGFGWSSGREGKGEGKKRRTGKKGKEKKASVLDRLQYAQGCAAAVLTV